MSFKNQTKIINSLFIILFFTLNTMSLVSCSDQIKSKFSINRNIIEVKSDPEFFSEVKNCFDSLDEGVFIHYDYSDEEEKEETEEEEESSESYEEELAQLKIIEENIEKFKKGEIDEEELKLSAVKVDKMLTKYNKNDLSEKSEMDFENGNIASTHNDEEEYFNEEDQNSMIKYFISEKLDDTNEIESTAFDSDIINTIKKLNLLKLFTMETNVKVNLAAKF